MFSSILRVGRFTLFSIFPGVPQFWLAPVLGNEDDFVQSIKCMTALRLYCSAAWQCLPGALVSSLSYIAAIDIL